MTLHEQRLAALREARELLAAAGDDGLTAEALAQVDALQATADALQGRIDAQATQVAHAARLDAEISRVQAPRPRRVPELTQAREPIVVVPGHASDPAAGFRSPREFLASVMAEGRGARMDERLRRLATVGSDEASTFDDVHGGFLVPESFQPQPMQMEQEPDPVGLATLKVPMSMPVVNLAARVDKDHSTSVSGGLRVYRRAEADTSAASRIAYEKIRLEAMGLFGIAYATEEILTDSPVSFAALIAAGFGEEFAAKKMEERLNGVGGGEFVGVNTSGCLISVDKETGQTAATIVYENIIKMFAQCWRPQFWLASKTCIPQLALLNFSVGTGGVPIWMAGAQGGLPGTLLGLPIHYSERMAAVGTAGDIMLCNWSQYLEGSYGTPGSAESIHVRFVNHERCFKFFERCAGAPWWSSVLTPTRGDTQSTFVRLAVRA